MDEPNKERWALEKTNEAIKALYKEIEKKNEQLKKLDQLKSQFVANVSHEFKNPLTIIGEYLSIVLDGVAGEVNPKQKEILGSCRKTVDRLNRLVMDLLDLSKIEAGKMELKREGIDIVQLIEEVSADCATQISKKELLFRKDISYNVGFIWGDRDKLTIVVVNLLDNAIKYIQEKGVIVLRASGTENEVRVEISDNGPGIPPEYREKIFDKFERINTEKQEGTGLGLPITKDIIGLHKGKIWVESELGKGSTFIFLLPRDLRTVH
ncbi:MAG: HAMP domain-containing histidine kinase [Candidatus Omnitrophica bacterium]|nr:HAMP domain-containing histidine kinase [Candidatus Omnitrophota bacterium]